MKRLLITLCCLYLCFAVSYAQEEAAKTHFRVGVTYHTGLNSLSTRAEGFRSEGFVWANIPCLFADVLLAENVWLSVGMRYNTKGGNISYLQNYITSASGMLVDDRVLSQFKIRYIDVPILLKVFTNEFGQWSFNGGLGVSPGFRIGAFVEEMYRDFRTPPGQQPAIEGTLSRTRQAMNDTKLFDLSGALQLNVEYRLAQRTALTMGLGGDLGFLNVLNPLDNELSGKSPVSRTRQVYLSVGVIF